MWPLRQTISEIDVILVCANDWFHVKFEILNQNNFVILQYYFISSFTKSLEGLPVDRKKIAVVNLRKLVNAKPKPKPPSPPPPALAAGSNKEGSPMTAEEELAKRQGSVAPSVLKARLTQREASMLEATQAQAKAAVERTFSGISPSAFEN